MKLLFDENLSHRLAQPGTIEELLRRNSIRIHEFEREAATALLILP